MLTYNHPLKTLLEEIKVYRFYIIISAISLFASYSPYFLFPTEKIIHLGDENAFFELGTAICFLLGGGLMIYLFSKRKNIFFLLLGCLLLFGAGEELSWGQHILHFNTPESIKNVNVQKEFNIHNIEVFNTEKFNSCRKSGLQRLTEMNFLFRLFYIFYGIILPLTYLISAPVKKIIDKIYLPLPSLTVGVFFFLNWLAYKFTLQLARPNQPTPYYESSTEIFEFAVSFVWLIISVCFLTNHSYNRIKVRVR